jgi:hypothetical protein
MRHKGFSTANRPAEWAKGDGGAALDGPDAQIKTNKANRNTIPPKKLRRFIDFSLR